MGTLERLGARQLQEAMTGYRDVLRVHQEALNRLNVYPVPDGDTGTNMALTMESVVAELSQRTTAASPDDGHDLGGLATPDVCGAISHGALMGARGNSGVILSQILRRLAEGLARPDDAGGPEMAAALRAASNGAYEAVVRPVEGTILTVAKAAANGAASASLAGKALVEVLEAARSAAAYSLARTPDLLPVLKEAGVVDAGGAGFALLIDVLLNVVDGRPLPDPAPTPPGPAPGERTAGALSHSGPRYEVMFLLDAPDDAVGAFKEAWDALGDSIAVVGGDGLWNCHVHTDDIGAAVEAGLDCGGRPRQIRVTDLAEQVAEEAWVREATADPGDGLDVGPPPGARCAVVAVGAGDGVGRIFASLGVAGMIAGGQSMNPSTGQILEAVEAADQDEMVVLPNNRNVVPAALQVDALTAKTVRVVPTTGVADGLAAMMAYDPDLSAGDNVEVMARAAGRVAVGEVTRAVRAATTGAGPVAEGDFLGIGPTGIEVVDASRPAAANRLIERLVTDEHELVTVITGDGSSEADTAAITGWLAEHRPGVSVEVHHGGQPLYAYLFSAE